MAVVTEEHSAFFVFEDARRWNVASPLSWLGKGGDVKVDYAKTVETCVEIREVRSIYTLPASCVCLCPLCGVPLLCTP